MLQTEQTGNCKLDIPQTHHRIEQLNAPNLHDIIYLLRMQSSTWHCRDTNKPQAATHSQLYLISATLNHL